MTAAEFRVLFPEFANAPTALIESRIAWALARTPEAIWGEHFEQGLAFMAAHFLAMLPEAKAMRKGEKAGETMYLAERKRLAKIVGSASAYRTAGLPSTPIDGAALRQAAAPDGWPAGGCSGC